MFGLARLAALLFLQNSCSLPPAVALANNSSRISITEHARLDALTRRPIELTWRSAPLREAQATNWLPNADEALLSLESQICEPPVNSSVIEGKGIG